MTPEAVRLQKEGRVWLRGALSPCEVDCLARLTDLDDKPGARHGRTSALYRAVESSELTKRLNDHWPKVRMQRLVSFNKSASANWRLPWHQDRVIAMDRKVVDPKFGKWSRKAGIWHCEPPIDVLQQMLFVRLHLDDADADNGAMEIALCSHLEGAIPKVEAKAVAARFQTEVTSAKSGDVLVLAMLILHRSRPSDSQGNRRVLRADFA